VRATPLLLALALSGCVRSEPVAQGAVVESVGRGGAAARAGIQPGDLLLRWQADGRSGAIRSPFDLLQAEIDVAPVRSLRLRGRRGGQDLTFALPPVEWKLYARPALAPDPLRRYQEAEGQLADVGGEKAPSLDVLARDLALVASPLDSAAALLGLGRGLAALKRWPQAREAYAAARVQLEKVGDPLASAVLAEAEGDALRGQNDLSAAESAYRRALALRAGARPESLAVAASLVTLARLEQYRGDLEAAEPLWRQALKISGSKAEGSLPVATCLVGLGSALLARGALDEAGDLYRQALALQERLAPGSAEVAETLSGLGVVARNRGDLQSAEDFCRRGLAIEEALDPESERVGYGLNRLGVIAKDRGQLEEAEALYRRALAIFEKARPGGIEVAGCFNNLGNMARLQRDWEAAEGFHRRALALRETLAPGSLDVAGSLQNLAEVLREREEWAAAEALYLRALAIKEKRAPGSLTHSSTLFGLGETAAGRGDFKRALELHQRGLEIRSRLSPGSTGESDALYCVGACLRKLGRREEAVDRFRASIEALETQRGRLGASGPGQSGFALQTSEAYDDLVDLLVELGRPAEAFGVLERSRARGLLAMLAERDIVFAADVPRELEVERLRVDADYDLALDRLGRQRDDAEIEKIRVRLAELRDRQADVARRIQRASPRLASLRYPKPLDLEAAQAALDPGTVLLSYSVAKARSFLFVVASKADRRAPGDPGFATVPIPLGDEALRDRVLAYRGLVDRGKERPGAEAALTAQGSRLYDLLVRPAEAWIGPARRVLIAPAGALNALPFAALVRSPDPLQYLAEWKPLHTIPSTTIYAEVQKERRQRPQSSPSLVAFGDPLRPAGLPPGGAGGDSLVARAGALGPLTHAREEVEGIAELFGAEAVTYLGPEATEERARSVGRGPRYVHFACHALLDRRFPLESALVLSPGREGTERGENGLLQAWEVFERVRIDADLVTLSACETGLGREMAAEGLLGLSRAFQYAGARSVLASLWAISDRATAGLMRGFYRGLRKGLPKDEALQAAEAEAIASGAPPFEWAAFQLTGDWK
jgi:CHAT domain-containing protein/Tfp pilus assembly protein PilF